MKIYTKTGDKGKTSLYDHTRVDKDSIRVESYGTIDELNAYLGLARNFIDDNQVIGIIYDIQRQLFDVGGQLATLDQQMFPTKISENQIEGLEKIIDEFLVKIEQIDKFIIPGTNKASASLHVARTVCRRAERRMITLAKTEEIDPFLIKYINRLSDVLYALARFLESELRYVEF